ncbi:PilZ domain-containing protein [Sphingomonas gellani]|uniref:PilZ domain-containing protein n=1 Tax=Sphingomonas gellani TaxID=1166340 RepID=A0A1H7YXP9_9SPHN|nr:PilZ domain-containing protein [Sphingomonas gellani]SEM50926.1 PilZ domain-containing protein [Sphingomonas gellani]
MTEARREHRDEVHHRTRGTGPDGRPLTLVVVNLSPSGLMVRCEADYAVGDSILVQLPLVGTVTAEIRWALGGRFGCRMEPAIPAGRYYAVLSAMGGATG